jgi:hypothetical protein
LQGKQRPLLSRNSLGPHVGLAQTPFYGLWKAGHLLQPPPGALTSRFGLHALGEAAYSQPVP